MAQSGYTPISLYFSATGAAVPVAGNLVAGELALNTNDGKLYYKNSSGVVTLLAGATAGPAGGSTTQVQYNNAGVLAGITGATTNGTALTLVAPVLGTPASGIVTNLTGTASININGTVGATTATTGAFTTLSASGTSTMAAINASGNVTISNDKALFVGNGSFDTMQLLPLAAGSGTRVYSQNAAQTDLTNLTFLAGTTTFNYRTGVNTSTAGLTITTGTGAVTIPGTLGVTGDITGSGSNGFKTGADNRGLYFNGTRNGILGSNAADTVSIAAANANVAVFGAASTSLTGTLGVTGNINVSSSNIVLTAATGAINMVGALTLAPASANPLITLTDVTKGSGYIQGGVNTGGTGAGDYWMFNVPTSRGLSWAVNNSTVLNAVAGGVVSPVSIRSTATSNTVGTPTFYLSASMIREGADASFNVDTFDGAAYQNRLKIVGATGAVTIPGTLGLGNAGNSGIQLYVTATGTKYGLYVDGSSGVMLYSGINSQTFTGGESATNSALYVRKDSTSSRSISAAGTINASGADYAEYESNGGLVIAKGDVVGFSADGVLTLKFSEAVRFGIKSTNPSYVGGDTFASADALGEHPRHAAIGNEDADEAELAEDIAAYELRLEAARQLVDRVAYSGKVPVNVLDATAGGYIIASDDGGKIAGAFVADVNFEQYKRVVGRVNRVLPDGRAEVAVIVH